MAMPGAARNRRMVEVIPSATPARAGGRRETRTGPDRRTTARWRSRTSSDRGETKPSYTHDPLRARRRRDRDDLRRVLPGGGRHGGREG